MQNVVAIGGSIAAGKTTLLGQIATRCAERGLRCKVMHELACETLHKSIGDALPWADAVYFAHRAQMLIDAPEVAKNYDLVLIERIVLDHLAFIDAFEACGIGLPEQNARTRAMASELDLPKVGTYVYLDLPPEKGLLRKESRGYGHDGAFDLNFYTAHRKAYLDRIHADYANPLILDWTDFGGNAPVDTLIDELLARSAR
ncbi:MAG: AAA family ATPase [Chlamydiia bacterium]|nr:AAA family ATPase [Chlamydiia bacterium]